MATHGHKPVKSCRHCLAMAKKDRFHSAITAGLAVGLISLVSVLLLGNPAPASFDVLSSWAGTLGLLALMLESIHRRLRLLENRLYEHARELSELTARRRRRRR